jgi:hypothetical protein
MKQLVFVSLALTLSVTTMGRGQTRSDGGPIVVSLPQGFDTESCRLQYFLVGSFGGYGGVLQPKRDVSQYEIETVHEGAAVERLKAILYCAGYQAETIVLDSLHDVGGRHIQRHPKPLAPIPFRGVVRGLTAQNAQRLHVDVAYTPFWICEFFGMPDCLLGAWTVASAELDGDGRFAIALPDFDRDGVIASFKNPGMFAFRIRDPQTRNWLFNLKPATSQSPMGGIPVAGRYPGEQVFDAEVSR